MDEVYNKFDRFKKKFHDVLRAEHKNHMLLLSRMPCVAFLELLKTYEYMSNEELEILFFSELKITPAIIESYDDADVDILKLYIDYFRQIAASI